MKKNILLTLSILVLLELLSMIQAQITLKLYKYCIVGSGPGGLQMAYFLKKANRKYIVFEKNKISGSFFTHYPRHRQLLSVNKKFTGAKNAEFNLRHDWNSLLSDNASLIMPNYSDKYYPHADELVRYLNDYANQFKLNIQYDTNIVRISRVHYKKKIKFKMMDQRNTLTLCDFAIISTGLSVPYIPPNITGIDLTEGYESISTNASDYEGQSVLILGQGNSAFETAQAISSTCNFLHMHGRGGVRLATSTHYIGDVRAVNSKVIDSYQLKTLDGLNEQDIRKMGFVKTPDNRIKDCPKTSKGDLEDDIRNSGYDRVIRCLGFQHDRSIYSVNAYPKSGSGRLYKYPEIRPNFESVSVPKMFFAGALTHSLDFRHSGGCCIQGFRYTVRALHRLLEWRYHKQPWPSIPVTSANLIDHLLTRINQASGLYQMFGKLVDIIIIGHNHSHQYLEEVPVGIIPELKTETGRDIKNGFITLTFEYGKEFSGKGKDTLGPENYNHTAKTAHRSGNIHPIIRYYKNFIKSKKDEASIPPANKEHHVLEDFLTDWSVYNHHGHYINLFIQSILQTDLRHFYVKSCFELSMTFKTLPTSCDRTVIERSKLKT